MPDTMRAIRLTGPVDIDRLTVSDVPIPDVRPGWVRIRVMALGINESEQTSREGKSDATMMGGPAPVHPAGTVCFVGALAGQWTIPNFSPFSIPSGGQPGKHVVVLA